MQGIVVKVDGSGRLTVRNRRFLKKLMHDKGLFPMGTTASHPVSTPAKYPKAPEPLSSGIPVVACLLPPPTLSLSYSDQVSVPGSTTLSCNSKIANQLRGPYY